MRLSIITLNFKKKELTLACIESVYKHYQKHFEKSEIEMIVVDNFSEDDSVPMIEKAIKKQKYVNVSLVANDTNAGFGGGCNLGAESAKGEYLFFLNNDTKALDSGFLGMMDFMDTRPQVGILGGRMENLNRTPQASAGKFYTLGNAILMLFGLQRFGLLYTSPLSITKVDWVSGGCMLVRRSLFTKLDGFDPDIFMYMEDVELCFRAKKAGALTYFYPNVSVMHLEHGSTNRSFAIVHIYEGLLHFYKKYMPSWQLWVLQCILKAKAVVLVQLGKVTKNAYLTATYEEALTVFR